MRLDRQWADDEKRQPLSRNLIHFIVEVATEWASGSDKERADRCTTWIAAGDKGGKAPYTYWRSLHEHQRRDRRRKFQKARESAIPLFGGRLFS